MEWLPTWEQLGSILVLMLSISAVIGFFMKIGEKKREEKRTFSLAILGMQNNITKILESIAKIEGKMDTSANRIIEIERRNAVYENKLDAAWVAIDKIEKNCTEIQREKRDHRKEIVS